MKASLNQIVGYVQPPAKPGDSSKIIKARLIKHHQGDVARLDFSEGTPGTDGFKEKHAIADYNDDKVTENTWHLLEPEPAPGSPSARKPAAASA